MDNIAPNLLNRLEEEEWVNPDAPPYTYNVAEGLRMLEEPLPQEQIDEIHRQIQEEIERNDPRKQNYFMRLDTKSVIRTEKEYNWCIENRIPMKVVTYEGAKQALMQLDARERQEKKAKQKRKTAKKSRRKNR